MALMPAKQANIKQDTTIVSKRKRVIGGQFPIHNVNGHMNRLRSWMSRFTGVGTEYLPNYLRWMRMMDGKRNKFKGIHLHYLVNENFSYPTF